MSRQNELAETVRRALERYFRDMDGERPSDIYDMVLKNVEKPMIETVLGKAAGNLTLAAAMLGIDRNTCARKCSSCASSDPGPAGPHQRVGQDGRGRAVARARRGSACRSCRPAEPRSCSRAKASAVTEVSSYTGFPRCSTAG
jgi:Fis family transcriptional regulator